MATGGKALEILSYLTGGVPTRTLQNLISPVLKHTGRGPSAKDWTVEDWAKAIIAACSGCKPVTIEQDVAAIHSMPLIRAGGVEVEGDFAGFTFHKEKTVGATIETIIRDFARLYAPQVEGGTWPNMRFTVGFIEAGRAVEIMASIVGDPTDRYVAMRFGREHPAIFYHRFVRLQEIRGEHFWIMVSRPDRNWQIHLDTAKESAAEAQQQESAEVGP
jgi:hypothetical protein